MKIDTIRSGGHSQGGLDQTGGTLSGPLLLSRDPQVPMEAATKRYIDNNVSSLNASNITTGTLPIARLPGFSGDVNSEAGSNSILLSNTGITAGEYGKIVVDAKGRATNGTGLGNSDIPNINFNKIVSNKPTTLSGYGITDGITVSGGTLTGALNLSSNPSSGDNLVPKQYVDGMLNNLSSAKTGDVVRKAYSTTPIGFLKCNGAEVDKTTYADLYAIIGESNNSYNIIGSGKPWQQQYEINKQQLSDIATWTTGTSLPGAFTYSQAIVTKNRVYLLGGRNVSAYTSTVYTAPINTDGTLGAWSTATSLPGVLGLTSAVVTKNRVYLLGGTTNGSNAVSIVYTAQINSDGTLGTWITDTNLPVTIFGFQSLVTKNRIYIFGGYNGTTNVSTVYTAPVNSDGTLGTWTTGTALPEVMYLPHLVTTKNRVYLMGGNGVGTTYLSVIYTAVINNDGTIGTWVNAGSLPITNSGGSTVVTKNKVYLIGGWSGSSALNSSYSCNINQDGTLGAWIAGANLPGVLGYSCVITTSSRIYLLGGHTGNFVSTVYQGLFSGGLNDYSPYYEDFITNYMMPGSGKPWQQQYQINQSQTGEITGWTSSGTLPSAVSAAQAIVTKNRVYLMGGINSSENNISTVYTAVINTDGTLGTWTTTTSLPDVVSRAQAVVTKNRVYLMGGYRNSSTVATVYTAPINADGTLGTWTTSSNLPGALALSTSIVTKSRVYLLGGSTNATNGVSTVYTAPINADGTLGTWVAGTSLPGGLGWSQAIVTKNRVYLLGGWTSSAVTTVYTAPINSDGLIGTWTTGTALPAALHWTQAFVTNNRVYLLGGWNNSNVINATYNAPILNDGTLGAWVTGTSLSATNGVSQCIVVKNKIHLLGGRNEASSIVSNIYSATIAEGLNDYSEYYDGTITPFEPVDPTTTFKLPDMSNTDVNGIYHYIKY